MTRTIGRRINTIAVVFTSMMGKRSLVRGWCVAALTALTLIALPSGASAFSKAIWGQVYRHGVNQFPLYRTLGVKIFEVALRWNEAAPTRPASPTDPADPAYTWPAEVTQAVSQARRFHMRVLIQLTDAPAWANGGHSDPSWAPTRPSDFAAFAAAAARRYPSVHLWMIWGEPTKAGDFFPFTGAVPGQRLNAAQKVAPHLYARILDSAYGALKSVSARNRVIGGCTFSTGALDTLQWISNLRLPNGKPPRMDMYAHNPFTYKPPSFHDTVDPFDEVQFSDLPELAKWIDRYLHPGLPLFLSEWTIPTAPDREFNFWVNPKVAAHWVTDAFRLARHWSRIYALGWVNVYDDPPITTGGLLTADGHRKPAFRAFARG
jgi:hypothetical protein